MKLGILTASSASQAVHGAPCSGKRPLPEATAGVWCVYRDISREICTTPIEPRGFPEGALKESLVSFYNVDHPACEGAC